MAEVVRAKYKGRDTGEGMPYFHGVPARDLTDDDFDSLTPDNKELVRKSDLYDYTPYTEKSREGRVAAAAPRQEPSADKPVEGDVK